MKELSKLIYLCIALVMITSCEQETIESENLNNAVQDELLIQDFQSLSEIIESGIDIQSYMESIINETPQFKGSSKSVEELNGITIYSSREDFPCDNLPTEDFEKSSIPFSNVDALFEPLNDNTDNTYINPGDIVEGIEIWTNLDLELVLLGEGFLGVPSNMVGANIFEDNTTIDFTSGDVTSVSFDLYFIIGPPSQVTIELTGDSGVIGSFSVLGNSEGTYVGFESETPVKRIEIVAASNGGAELIDNISFGICDSDGDGCIDKEDRHKYSDLRDEISIGDCDFQIENAFTDCGTTMMDELNDLIERVSAEAQKTRRPWERPYDSQGEFKRGMIFLSSVWASRGFIEWSDASEILECVENSNIDFEHNYPD